MKASLSIYGLYEYDDSIFDNLVLPSGMEDHRQELITEILLECSDFALLYPDWDFMKMLIGVWSKNELLIWERMYQSETIEYNPIENYDRREALTRSVSSLSENQSSSASAGSAKSKAQNSSSSGAVSTGGKTAYDSDSFKDVSRTTNTGSDSGSSSSDSSSNEAVNSASRAASNGAETVINHVHGNIGVTTAPQMLEGFREISNFCTVDFICDSFKDRFCVQVY